MDLLIYVVELLNYVVELTIIDVELTNIDVELTFQSTSPPFTPHLTTLYPVTQANIAR